MRDLAGKVVVVTGAGGGIGRALAGAFAAAGAKLALADLDAAALQETAAALPGEAEALRVPTDVAEPAGLDALARKTLEAFGAAHVLCNAAAASCDGPVWEPTPPDWDWVFGVNVWGVVNGLRSFVPLFLEQGEEAHVVNACSALGPSAPAGSGLTAASRHAVLAISEALHADLAEAGAEHVGVSLLCHAAHGLAPEQVAARVVSAVRERRFWVLPAPQSGSREAQPNGEPPRQR